MTHPETYTLTREEWLMVNRVLSGSALRTTTAKEDLVFKGEIREAQAILSKSYERAEKESA